MKKTFRRALDLAAIVAIAVALVGLITTDRGVVREGLQVGTTPATITRAAGAVDDSAPVVVIAHGFAGSRQLMAPFANTLARAGYVAVSFDFRGHGRNPIALGGSITDEDGATRVLMEETARVVQAARALRDGRVALLGHSMATDILVRLAAVEPEIAATVAVSMFSPAVTAEVPRNLLMISGAWEPMLRDEAVRAASLVAAPETAEEGLTYGLFEDGSARRAVVAPRVEHVGVLYSATSLMEAVRWLDQVFARPTVADLRIDRRGPFILALLVGVLLLARPMARLLPRAADAPAGAGLGWGRLWLPLLLPMIATPLILWPLPTSFLPVVVADYLAMHFLLYGLLTWACLAWVGRRTRPLVAARPVTVSRPVLMLATLGVVAYGFVAIIWPVDRWVTSFVPGEGRRLLIVAMLAGTLAYFLSVEWATRGQGAARGGYLVAKLAFLVSLGIAVALDFERLFFLLIIVPVIVVYLILYGLISGWVYARVRHPFAGATANAVAFAWALAVTFPMLTG
ncbi:MAG: alpha/beta fold hydrolase [Rhodobacteraceae bacterium]|nr:alpha/beta fold hydrolase [Paracoccaceae bacterium]